MNKNTVILVIIALIGVAAFVYLWSGSANEAKAPTNGTSAESTSAPDTAAPASPATGGTTGSGAPKSTSPNPAPTPTPVTITKDGIYIISYTASGFSPRELKVPAGTAVRFVNNSSKVMQIAADDQKSSLLNSINQSQSVGKGGVYNFSFVNQATWAYHNRLYPEDKGTVIVY